MTCDHRLFGLPSGLLCNQSADHEGGHTYTGSSAPDGHDDSERRAEETRG